MAEKQSSNVDQEYIDELSHLLSVAKHPRTTTLLQAAIKDAQSDDVETPVGNGSDTPTRTTAEGKAGARSTEVNPQAAVRVAAQTSRVPQAKTKYTAKITEYGWDQSDNYVKLYITSLKGLDKLTQGGVHTSFEERSMEVDLEGVNGKNYSLVINDLFGAIIPDQSSAKVKSGTVIVSLRKTKKDRWQFLTHREKKLKDAKDTKPSKGIKEEDPGAGLMNMMKQMYRDGDDEIKRTIAKSWHESHQKRAKGEDSF